MQKSGLIERLSARRTIREGADRPAPKGGVKRYFFLLGAHFGKFMALNLLFVFCSLPVVTLPASLCALDRVCIKLVRDGNCFLLDDFFEEFRKSFGKAIPPGLLFGGGLAAAYYLCSLGLTNSGSLYGMLFMATGIFLSAFVLLRGSWVFVLIAMLPLRTADILKNARILMLRECGRSAGMLLALAVAIALALLLFPVSAILMGLLLFSLLQYTICFLANRAVQQHILDPYEKLQQEEKRYAGAAD